MVVQHNLTAMNSNRMLGITTKSQAKSTEKLSSGYRINRAADDAAGLAISEKMRKQIRGLTQASANAQDGISAVQTAEGALTEVHDMLQRMNELAVKAGNGTQSESDRQSIQDEIDQLITEIDRVSETTKFNETYLLKGSGKNKNAGEVSGKVDGKIQEGVVTKAKGNIFKGTMDMADATKLDAGTEDKATITYLDAEGNKRTKDVTFKTGADAKATAANLAEAINADSDLKKVFKASSNAAGELSVESKLDGTKTDGTKNAVTEITFESAMTASTGAPGGVTRLNKFTATPETEDAVGESYAIAIGKGANNTTAATASTLNTAVSGNGVLTDGESITINGKTYTYDANKSDSAANSFKTLEDLQKLLEADGYEADIVATATKTLKTYDDSGNVTNTEKVEESLNILDAKVGSTALGELAATDFTAGDFFKTDTANDGSTAETIATAYEDIKVQLVITQKASVDQASDVLNFSLQVGADTTEENKISVDIESMSAKSLGIENISVTGEDSTNADEAVNTIADAIAKVSAQRSALGAIQNRLEHTINNLDNVVENTTSAESAIRDTDMATEMVKYSNNNILAQAGQAMLAQANQANQGVLSLLG
ncbi:MAG: flagellar hook protein [Lachnospiraceae bacterium]|nr:flagellar hook protein [Lachnospiraceae bacterium]